jgi:carboxypeptidase family protein
MPRWLRVAAVIGLTAAACHGKSSPTAPAAQAPRPIVGFPTAGKIDGPGSIPPDGTAQFRYIASYSDGTSSDLTTTVGWLSRDPTVLTIDRDGRATAVSRGVTDVVATYAGSTSKLVRVLEDGTFELRGRIVDGSFALPGAFVAVTRGIGQGLNATTDSAGAYALFGVAGDIELRVSADGYSSATAALTIGTTILAPDIRLQPLAAPADFSGVWHMMLSASPSCAQLPADLLVRSYAVTIAQGDSSAATLRIDSPTLQKPLSTFAHVVGTAMTVGLLALPDYYYGGNPTYDLLETLEPGRFLGIDGVARLDSSGGALRGTLNGRLTLYTGSTNYFGSRRAAACAAADHALVLTR